MNLNRNIKLFPGRTVNTKASEEYVHVVFTYADVDLKWDGWVPVEYRRTGVSISQDDTDGLAEHLNNVLVIGFNQQNTRYRLMCLLWDIGHGILGA